MRLNLKCTGCFFNSAMDAITVAGIKGLEQEQIRKEVSKYLHGLSLDDLPPVLGKNVYAIVQENVAGKDIYASIKKESNSKILSIYSTLKGIVESAKEPLKTAVQLSIIGNSVDYTTIHSLSTDDLLQSIEQEMANLDISDKRLFDFDGFLSSLNSASRILYIADNAGEIVFDRILIETILTENKKEVFFSVKDSPIFNDALKADALACGVDTCATIISCGTNTPGIILKLCSQDFLDVYDSAQLVISKGHSNYTGLSIENKCIYFLFPVNCRVISQDIGVDVGSVILHRAQHFNR